MRNIKRFAAVNTKVLALEGNLLTDEDFREILKKKSVAGAVRYLKDNTAYRSILEDTHLNNIQAKELEILFKKHIARQAGKLIHYFTGEYRRFFRMLVLRYEIEDLKVYLRTVNRREDRLKAGQFTILPGGYTGFSKQRLEGSENLEDCIENLKGTVYYPLLKPHLNEKPDKRHFHMDMVLDKLYFRLLNRQSGKLEAKDSRLVGELLGKNIDLLNLQWIYRGLRFYTLSPEELINYTLQDGYALNYHRIKELCYSGNAQELVDKMAGSKYGFLFDNKSTMEVFMERRIERYLYYLFLEYKRREKMNIIETNVYLHLLEFETRDISSAIEAIKYGLDLEQSRGFLIRRI